MKHFRILRSRKRLFFQNKQIFAGLSETKTEIDVLKGTLRWVCFFYRKFFCFYWFFGIWAKILWLLAKMFQKVPKNINLRIPSNNSSGQVFFWKYDTNDAHFWNWGGKKSFSLPKSFGSVAETAFSVSTADIEEKVWERANFSIISWFWTKLSGFWANVFLHRQKNYIQLSKLRYTFPGYNSRIKVFDENPMFLNQLTTSRSKNLTQFWREHFGSAIRTAF